MKEGNFLSCVNLGLSEAFNNKSKIISTFLVSALLIGIVISLLSFAITVPKKLEEELHKEYVNGPAVLASRVTPAKLNNNLIFDKNISITSMQIDGMYEILPYLSFYKSDYELDYELIFSSPFVGEKLQYKPNAVNHYLIDGEQFDEKIHNSNHDIIPIWVSLGFKTKNNLSVGDEICMKYNENEFYIKIMGVVNVPKGIDMDYLLSNCDVLFPFSFSEELFRLAELPLTMKGFINIDIGNYEKAVDNLEKNHVWISRNNFFEMHKNSFNTFSALLYSLSILSLIITIIISYNLFQMFISSRKRYIGILKALGMNNRRISLIYFSILFVIMFIATMLGWGISKVINLSMADSFGYVVGSSERMLVHVSALVPLAVFGAILLLLLICYMRLYKLISKISVIEVLTERD